MPSKLKPSIPAPRFLLAGASMLAPVVMQGRRGEWSAGAQARLIALKAANASKKMLRRQSQRGCMASVICFLENKVRSIHWSGFAHTRQDGKTEWSGSAYGPANVGRTEGDGTLFFRDTLLHGRAPHHLTPQLAAGLKGEPFMRDVDAEFLVLNEIAGLAIRNGFDKGLVALAVEYPPCTSCRSVIAEFRVKFPAIRLVVSAPPDRAAQSATLVLAPPLGP